MLSTSQYTKVKMASEGKGGQPVVVNWEQESNPQSLYNCTFSKMANKKSVRSGGTCL